MRDVKPAPPGNVGASVPIWAEAARKVLSLARFRFTSATTPMLSKCPRCGSQDLQRSSVRFYEKPRKVLTAARPYRCGTCQRRVWGQVHVIHRGAAQSGTVDASLQSDSTPLDLAELDRALERH